MKDSDIRGFFKNNEIKQKKILNTNTSPDIKNINISDTPIIISSDKKRKCPEDLKQTINKDSIQSIKKKTTNKKSIEEKIIITNPIPPVVKNYKNKIIINDDEDDNNIYSNIHEEIIKEEIKKEELKKEEPFIRKAIIEYKPIINLKQEQKLIPITSNNFFAKKIEIHREDDINEKKHLNVKSTDIDLIKNSMEIENIINEPLKIETKEEIITKPVIPREIKINKTKEERKLLYKDIEKQSDNNILWTFKYNPNSLDEIIDNQIVVKKVIEWLNNWNDVVLNGNLREITDTSKSTKSKTDNINARACIISGPPGIGKTSSMRLISKMLNYRIFEMNASDQRNKSIIISKVGYLKDNTTLGYNINSGITEKNLIIMDEVDGMAGNDDKGGISALIEIIKITKIPIILICNDIYNQKLKSIINHCYDLRFSRPNKKSISKRLLEICKKEGFNLDSEVLESICDSNGNDIRQCINFLEMRFKTGSKLSNAFSKDSILMINSFEAVKKLLNKYESSKLTFKEKLDLFYIDFELIPIMIQENYLSSYGQSKNNLDLIKMVRSSDSISLGDILDTAIIKKNEWSLLPNKAICGVIGPSVYSSSNFQYTKFPELFGKYSKIRKTQRQLKDLKSNFHNFSLRSIKEEIIPLFLSIITNELVTNGKECINDIIEIFKKYKINTLLFKENILELQTSTKILNKWEKINSSLKATLTRRLNEEYKNHSIKKKKGKEIKTKYDDEGNILEEIISSEDEEEDKVTKTKARK